MIGANTSSTAALGSYKGQGISTEITEMVQKGDLITPASTAYPSGEAEGGDQVQRE